MSRAFALLVLAALCLLLMPPRAHAAAATHVTIANYAYGPATVTVRVGDSVSWMNHDQAKHDVVTASAPASFRSPLLSTGQTWTFRFTQPGTYSYYCSLHPDMKATIVVQPANTPAPPPFPPPSSSTVIPTTTSSIAAAPAPTSQPAPPSSSPSTTTSSQPPSAVATLEPAAAPARSLDYRLVLAGVVVGIATLCLLLISSRPDH